MIFALGRSLEANHTRYMTVEERAAHDRAKAERRKARQEVKDPVTCQRYSKAHDLCVTLSYVDGVLRGTLEASTLRHPKEGREELIAKLRARLEGLGTYDWRKGWSKETGAKEAKAWLDWLETHDALVRLGS